MNRQALIERVKIKVDEYTPSDEGVYHPLDAYIDPILDESAKSILRELPIERIPIEQFPLTAFSDFVYYQIIDLPESVMRIASVKMPLWERAVTTFYPEGSKEAAMQGNVVTRGTMHRPVVIQSRAFVDGHVTRLACYGCPSATPEATIVMVVNEKKPEEIPNELIEPLVTHTAAKVCQAVERDKSYQLLMAEYQRYL